MSFSSPAWLAGLLLIPALVAAYAVGRRRSRRYAVRFPALPTLLLAAAEAPTWRRHVPSALAIAALLPLSVALARPHVGGREAVEQASIVLVTDHSGSMDATDVEPTRLIAAERAAETFIDQVPKNLKIGAVAFSAAPDAVQAPTTDKGPARQVILSQIADGTTATGDALQTAIELLHPLHGRQPPSAIVLLSDGATTAGSNPLVAARQAARRRIPIYTVALGTPDATVPNADPFGPPLSAAPDFATLRDISRITHGVAFKASDSHGLSAIYKRLGSQLGSRDVQHEITVVFALLALALVLGAGVTAVRWGGRLP